ncbi:serine hydrolase domain-containing protein [Halomonas salipaludis]|uniref:6-aminohexanoate hydrolase n=1 Tax=Halomonas salipaludis TaxID=2032625 RepID=A0A2A2EQK1_9GAMM|nr:serine hydrolase [Halomonas salipaludis]PAU74830.1 6-aminohexanoate hydrolase [Halomonas salipaludis]
MTLKRNSSALAIAAIASFYSASCLAAPGDHTEEKWLSDTMINARANMFHPDLNYLTFQALDKMFSSRVVEASSTPWRFEEAPIEITETFSMEGKELSLDGFLESTRTNGLLIINDGKIAYERYRNGLSETQQHAVFSVSKSIISILIGSAVEDGKIASLDDMVIDYLPELEKSGFADTKVIDLLRMRSGVAWNEHYEFGGDTQLTEVHDNSLVAYAYRWCDYAETSSEKLHEPGTQFNYSTLDTSVLGCLLERAVGTTVAEYMSETIWQPAGMESDGFWIMDGPEPVGNEFYGAGFNATLRDLGRLGLMMLDKGQANGTQVIPEAWVAESTVSDPGYEYTSEDADIGYQYQWWTLPESQAYAAIGLYNQFIYIDPQSQTVIVKLSHTPEPLGWDEANFDFFEKISGLFAE